MNIIFDIDGTLCFDGQTLAPSVQQAIEQLFAKGHHVTFASARPIRDLLPIVDSFSKALLIGANGAMIQREQKIEMRQTISAKTYAAIWQLIEQFHLFYVIDDSFDYAAKLPAEHPLRKQIDPDKLATICDATAIKEPLKIILVGLAPARIKLIREEIVKIDASLSITEHQAEGTLDLSAKNINKYATAHYLGLEPYVAFGNDWNDQLLLKHADNAFFVGTQQGAEDLGLLHATIVSPEPAALVAAIETL